MSQLRLGFLVLGLTAIAAVLGAVGGGEEAAAPDGGPIHSELQPREFGAVSGFVHWRGVVPVWDQDPCEGEGEESGQSDHASTTMDHDHNACADSRGLVVGPAGGLKWAVVAFDGGQTPDQPLMPVEFDQRNLEFVSHVLAVRVGQEIIIRNSDDVLHNVHVSLGPRTLFNEAMPVFRKEIRRTFTEAGVYNVMCDVHPHMRGYIVVIPQGTAFDVTDSQGAFDLEGLPAGEQHLRIWHEQSGEMEVATHVMPNELAALEVALGHAMDDGHGEADHHDSMEDDHGDDHA